MALPSPALPPRTPLTREAIDASYFAARAVEEHVEGAGNATRFLGRTGGSPPFLPASASMALGGIAMPSGMITPGGSVRAVNLGVVKPPGAPTPGGLLGSSFLRRPARTPGIAGPSPLAWQLPLQDPGPTSVQVPGLPLSSLGSNSLHSMTLTDGSSANSEGGSALSVHSGPGAGFELNLGESSLLARRKGNKKGAGGSGDIKLDEGMGIGGLRISGGPGK